ncbi:MAG: Beta-ketoacyl synthase, N-terminal domain, partial [Pseudomonadota bacterium]
MRSSQRPGRHLAPPIAIIGAAARLPGAPDLSRFAALLRQGVDAVTEVPEDRF